MIAIDIDGVLNDYPSTWVSYLNNKLGTDYETLNDAKAEIPYNRYRKMKSDYRDQGLGLELNPKPGAARFLKALHDQGYYIIIMTARPIEMHNNMLQQTTEWFSRNNLIYDFLYFSQTKHLDIISKFHDLDFMVEDNLKFCNKVALQGYKVFLYDNEYNQGSANENVTRVFDYGEILKIINNLSISKTPIENLNDKSSVNSKAVSE